ncbi:MAG: tyrosine-type recombinase/integrase [Lewinellaceae bacterium]|nr:tyrosine-type recombinase/integrase [Lewinellaceae bacterium]
MFQETSFLNYLALERRFSPHTLTAYKHDLSQFIAFISEKHCLTSVSEVRHLHIRAWIVVQMQSGQSTRSINRRLSCLKSYFRFLKKRGHLEKDPMAKVVAPRTGKRLPVYVQEPQMVQLLDREGFGADYLSQCRRVILETLYATGLRRSELAGIKLQDIDNQRMVIRVMGKGGKERIVPFAAYLADLFRGFIQLRAETFPVTAEPWLFLNRNGGQVSPDFIYYSVKKHLSRVSVDEQRSPHVLRHSFATHLSNGGADLNAIKELLGHSSLAATQVYMHNSIERLKKVYDQAHPKGKSK